MKYRAIIAIGVLLAASRQAVAQQAPDLESRLAQRLDAETQASVMRVLQNAKQLELPIEPIVSKALLGAAFKQPSSVITQTVNVELERLVASRDALAPRPSANDIKAGAEAIALGVPSETIKDLRARFPERSMVVPLAVLGELVANKVPVQKAAAMVNRLMQRGASEGQLVAFSEKVRDDITRGVSPTEALAARTEGLIARLPMAPVTGAAGDAATGGFQTLGTPKKKP
jgi:hypothetical protein